MMNPDLLILYQRFDELYRQIHLICAVCQDHDCEGYVWLLKDEADLLIANKVPIIEINNRTLFIHSFEEKDGQIVVDKPKPPCHQRNAGLCSVYNARPLVCRMYPVGLMTENEEVVLVLHKDCKFSRDLQGEQKELFIRSVITILEETSTMLLNELIKMYREVDEISAFPNGPNSYEILLPIGKICCSRR